MLYGARRNEDVFLTHSEEEGDGANLTERQDTQRSTTSPMSAFLSIVKTFAGAGSFGLPWALKQSGLLAGTIGMIVLALLADYTMNLLVQCRRYIQCQEQFLGSDYWRVSGRKRPPLGVEENPNDSAYGVLDDDYHLGTGDTIQAVHGGHVSGSGNNRRVEVHGDKLDYIYDHSRIFNIVDLGFEAMGQFGKALVYFLFFTCNMGVCTIYLVAFSDLMTSMIPSIDQRIWMVFMIPVFLPLSWIRSFKWMSPFALVGTVCLIASLGSVIVYGFMERLPYLKAPWNYGQNSWVNISTLPLFFGVTSFLFNTHTMVLPIEQSMKNRRQYSATLHLAFIFVTVMNLAFAILGFMFFGSSIEDNAAKNLPNNVFVYIVKGTLCAELVLTFAIVLMPVGETIDEQVLHRYKKSPVTFYAFSTVARSILVLVVVSIAELFGNKFGIVMGFIGGISPNALGFILPPLFYLIIMRRRIGLISWLFNCFIIVFGVLAMIASTWVATLQLQQ